MFKYLFIIFILIISCSKEQNNEIENKKIIEKTEIKKFSINTNKLNEKNFYNLNSDYAILNKHLITIYNPKIVFFENNNQFYLTTKNALYNKKENFFEMNSIIITNKDNNFKLNLLDLNFFPTKNILEGNNANLNYFNNKINSKTLKTNTNFQIIKLKKVKAKLNL